MLIGRAASAHDAAGSHRRRTALGAIGYRKPAAVLLALRNHVVGREAFDHAFREYAASWAFKHPTPADFFRTIESSTGEDLSWFWRGFFYTHRRARHRDRQCRRRSRATGGTSPMIQLRRHTSIPFPVTMRLKLTDGSTQDVKLPGRRSGPSATATRRRSRCARRWPARGSGPTVPFPISTRQTIRGGARRPRTGSGSVTTGGLVSSMNTHLDTSATAQIAGAVGAARGFPRAVDCESGRFARDLALRSRIGVPPAAPHVRRNGDFHLQVRTQCQDSQCGRRTGGSRCSS